MMRIFKYFAALFIGVPSKDWKKTNVHTFFKGIFYGLYEMYFLHLHKIIFEVFAQIFRTEHCLPTVLYSCIRISLI